MHCCIITCKIPLDMPSYYGRQLIRSLVYPTLEEFGYVLPEGDLQEKIDRRYDMEHTKECSFSIFLEDEEAMKTASIRAEWKPLDTTMKLDSDERKALRRMSKKRQREVETDCHICLESCKRPTTIECEHTFCYKCIQKWMGIKRQCPVCDKPINVEKYAHKRRRKRPCRRTLPR